MNNNDKSSLEARCICGRYITLGEIAGEVNTSLYRCPECIEKENRKSFEESFWFDKNY